MTTIEVIDAIKNNESKRLFKVLYSFAFPPVLRYIKQKRGKYEDAEDCFQDALIALIKKVTEDTYDPNYEVKNFLFVVSRNMWYNKSQKKENLNKQVLPEGFDIEDKALRVEEQLVAKEKKDAVEDLLSSAGEKCQKLLRLVMFENKSLKEVSDLMGFSSSEVVKTTHYRCKKKLKTYLLNNKTLLEQLRTS